MEPEEFDTRRTGLPTEARLEVRRQLCYRSDRCRCGATHPRSVEPMDSLVRGNDGE